MKSKGRNFFSCRKELFWCNLWILRSLDLVQDKMKCLCEEHKDHIMTLSMKQCNFIWAQKSFLFIMIVSWKKRYKALHFGHDTMKGNLIKLHLPFELIFIKEFLKHTLASFPLRDLIFTQCFNSFSHKIQILKHFTKFYCEGLFKT